MRNTTKGLLIAMLLLLPLLKAGGQEARILTLYFGQADATLHNRITGEGDSTLATLYLPPGFRADRSYPLVCFLRGGYGGDGRAAEELSWMFGREAVLLNLPLFKEEVEPLREDGSNRVSRWIVREADAEAIWRNVGPVLDSVRAIVPGIRPETSVLGGFSNGAHTIAVLLNTKGDKLLEYFDNFLLIGGGQGLRNTALLRRKDLLLMQGDQEGLLLEPIFRQARKERVYVEYVEMENTGHSIPPGYYPRLRDWITRSTR
jgi:hypothetical protein